MAKIRERFLSEFEERLLSGTARKLYLLRLKTKRTQCDMAKILNVTQGSISNLENGRRRPSLKVIIRVSAFFVIPIDDLIFMTDENFFNKYVRGA